MLSGVGRGYYGAQVERAERIFGSERVHWVEFRAFLADHVGTLDAAHRPPRPRAVHRRTRSSRTG